MRTLFLSTLAAISTLAACGKPDIMTDNCHIGIYRLEDGRLIDVAPSTGGLRWRLMDGRTSLIKPPERDGQAWRGSIGWTGRDDRLPIAFGDCAENRIAFDGQAGRKLDFQTLETRFTGHGGIELAGRLVLPPGADRVPLAVMVHGSESDSARDFRFEQRMWPAQGIAVFVYDKRGTSRPDATPRTSTCCRTTPQRPSGRRGGWRPDGRAASAWTGQARGAGSPRWRPPRFGSIL
jgi:hypothetical protein